ncbi:MAG: hypothetical protein AABZ44_04565, partial [Elusimicrobiota bacterium]
MTDAIASFLRNIPAAKLAYRFLRDPRAEIRYQRDLRYFRSICRPFASQQPEAGPSAIFVSLHDFIPSAKEECLWATALRLHGANPAFLVSKGARIVDYYKVFGFTRFIYINDLVDNAKTAQASRRCEEALRIAKSYEDLLGLTIDGVFAGSHALSWILRILHQGQVDINDPQVRPTLLEWLGKSITNIYAAQALFERHAPDLMLFNERGYTPYGEFFDIALLHGTNTIQFCASQRDNARIFKRYTYDTHTAHPQSISVSNCERFLKEPWTTNKQAALDAEFEHGYAKGKWFNFQRLQHNKTIKSRQELHAQLGLDPAKKTAVIYSHIFWDATFFYGKSLYPTYQRWYIETVKAACRNPALNWVIRVHPVNVWRLEADGIKSEYYEKTIIAREIGPLPGHVKLLEPHADVNTYSFFHGSDYCLTVRGTIGLECACFAIPVITAGSSRYSDMGFTIDPKSP